MVGVGKEMVVVVMATVVEEGEWMEARTVEGWGGSMAVGRAEAGLRVAGRGAVEAVDCTALNFPRSAGHDPAQVLGSSPLC
jgi:hypothetical protein